MLNKKEFRSMVAELKSSETSHERIVEILNLFEKSCYPEPTQYKIDKEITRAYQRHIELLGCHAPSHVRIYENGTKMVFFRGGFREGSGWTLWPDIRLQYTHLMANDIVVDNHKIINAINGNVREFPEGESPLRI